MRNFTMLSCCLLALSLAKSVVAQSTTEEESQVPALPPLPTILRAVKEPTPAHLRAAEQIWQQHQTVLGGDMLARYAMALALVANNRHANAFTLLENTPEVARKAGPLRRLWIWLAVKTKKDDVANHELQALILDLAARATVPLADAVPPTINDLDDLEFAAKMIVYLELVAERELPLDAAQAKTWWKRLEALPEPWRNDLPALRTAMQEEKTKQQLQQRANHCAWVAKTTQEFAEAKDRVAELEPKEKDAREKLAMVTSQYQDFLKQAEPQMETCKFRITQGQAALKALREPREPGQPGDERGRPVISGPLYTLYQQRLAEYRAAVQQYQAATIQINSTLAAFNQQAAELTREDNAYKSNIAQGQAQLRKLQTPLQNAQKTHERLRKTLAENATWDSPANLANLRTLELYRLLSLTAEAERIERKRN